MAKRVLLIVVDGLGIGALPDATGYGDAGCHTLDHIVESALRGGNKPRLPTLAGMGLGAIEGVDAVEQVTRPKASYGRMAEASAGKDSIAGHWEIAGRITEKAFSTYPGGLPKELLKRIATVTGRTVIGGKAVSGTEIIEELGAEHIKSGSLIVYTSADSLLQIAAHKEAVSVEELYEICELTRPVADEYNIARVIARPFAGTAGTFRRTSERKDFLTAPPPNTLLDILTEYGVGVAGVGKIGDIFARRGIGFELFTESDFDGLCKTLQALRYFEGREALIFTNLVEFDMLYCHRRDANGALAALERIDGYIGQLIEELGSEDLLIITADHGNDPTTASIDHSREYVPLLISTGDNRSGRAGARALGTLKTFADIGATILSYFSIVEELDGGSIDYSALEDVKK